METVRTTKPDAALSSGIGCRGLLTAERALVLAVETVAAILVAAEVLVLLASVVSRYALHQPLVWADEVASILFLWLAMIGSAVAFQRGEHMRMTAMVSRASPKTRSFLEAFALTTSLLFMVLISPSILHYVEEEAFIRTPALDIQNTWRASAIAAGFFLMAVFCFIRLIRHGAARQTMLAVAASVLAAGGMWLLQPAFGQLGNVNLLIFFVGVVGACVFSGVPIAFSFAAATLGYLSLTTQTPTEVIVGRIDEGVSHLILLAIPLFVFLGQLIEMNGMARAMVGFLASLLSHVRGGLHYVLVGAMYLVSGISGSKAADMAAIAPVLLPEMKQRGAKEGDLVALLAATGAQTETIPPSIVLLTIGSVTGVSIAALFTGGMIPALVLGVMLCGVVYWRNRHEVVAPRTAAGPGARRASLKAFGVAAPAIALPFVIRAAVVEGVATATEVSTIGIVYSVVVGILFYRQFDWKRIGPMLIETASLSGAILLIIGTATGMAWALTQSGFSTALAQAMSGLPGGSAVFLAVSILAFIILGSVLEGIPAIVLFGPLLFPVARAVGINEVHYSMVVVLAMGIGLFAPPFGVGYYAACAIAKVNPDKGMRPIIGYIIAMVVGLILVAVFPWLSIGLL
ncbi:TRAP transporter large permease subunit [Cupriavidus sp. P-10]|uniref:TRAP transporter large permease n=1 Tax=Cupriavidus sp. P-10 TaxID=2027911 RepID=UPI000E2EC5C1|nr:TRAP transporter large permease subunit [Cupriavidus sp. P-10]BDB27257.1 TRAP transporter large permease subunit [Cupriavidus sp. P-10]